MTLVRPWRHTFITNGIIFASGLASGIIAARLLGPEDRGLLAAIIYWPHFVAGVAAMGVNEAITIRTAKSGAGKSLKATTLALSLSLAFFVALVGLPLMPFLLGESRQGSLTFTQVYFALFVPMSFVAMNFLAIEQGEFKYRSFNVQRVIQALAYPLLMLVFWLSGLLTVASASIAVLSGTGIVAVIRLWHAGREIIAKPSMREAQELLGQGTRLHVTNLVMFLAIQADKMALVLFSNNIQLGLYVVATTAATATQSLFVQTYINVMLPAAAKSGLEQQNIGAILSTLRKLLALIFLSTLLMIVFLPFLLPMIFGEEFSDAVKYSQVLTVAFAFVGIKNVLIYLFRAWAINKPGILGEGLVSLILVSCAYPVLQGWGTLGLSVLVLCAHSLGAMYLLFFFLSCTQISMRQLLGMQRNICPHQKKYRANK